MNDGKIPDSFNEADIFPKTVEGKIDLMITIGKELLAIGDAIVEGLPSPEPGQVTPSWYIALRTLGAYTLKLSTIVAVQTECVEQMWNELKQP